MTDTTALTACASCAAEVPPGARYCPRCGADAPATEAPQPVRAAVRLEKPARKPKPARAAAPVAPAPTAPTSSWDALAPWPGSVEAPAAAVAPAPVTPVTLSKPDPVAPAAPVVPVAAAPASPPEVGRIPEFVTVSGPAWDEPDPSSRRGRDRGRRRPAAFLIPLLVVAVGLAGGAGYLLTRPPGRAAASVTAPPTQPVASAAQSAAPTTVATPSSTPTPTASAAAAPLTAVLSRTQLKAYFLSNADLLGASVRVRSGGQSNDYTLSAYSARYQSQTDPAVCRNAKGLMFFGDTDTPSSAGWDRRTIARKNDLALAGSTLVGDQQLRQFATVQAAQRFMQQQRAWFSTCSEVDYGTDDPIEYHGTIDDETSPDLLLTSATHSGADSNVEFDGWVRVGTVVFAAYLLGDGDTTVQDVQSGGRSVLLAAERKMQRAD